MTDLKEIEKLVEEELKSVAEKHGEYFCNNQLAWAVIKEELEEVQEELDELENYHGKMWVCARKRVPVYESARIMYGYAGAMIQEAVQVMAMCKKAMISEVENGKEKMV